MQPTKKESEVSILKGKTAVVTGSTSGIGLGCARAFADAGANIVLNGIEAPADVPQRRQALGVMDLLRLVEFTQRWDAAKAAVQNPPIELTSNSRFDIVLGAN
jgi:NAD(P)-dependent dehydrogenase (short-subunit alcohol dehydrogenase family)